MILSTPNTTRSPMATANSRPAVVTTSSSKVMPESLFQIRALVAWIDVLERLDHLDAAVGLHLTQIHGQRRVALLVHLDGAARAIDRHLGERLDDAVGAG